jgi:hypothetical protein
MKRILLTTALAFITYCSFAQWTAGTGIITTTNNVGIGTTTPSALLNVSSNGSNTNGILYVQSIDGGACGTLIRNGYYTYTSQDHAGAFYQSYGMRFNSSDNLWYRTATAVANYLPYMQLSTTGTIVFGGAASNATTDANPTLNPAMTINAGTGSVSIGTTDPKSYKLAVNGSAIATSMTVKLNTNWPDYVFKKDYQHLTLQELKIYIDQNQHLPDMPSAQEVGENGLNLGEMNKLLVKKVEELTLYLIEKDKEIKELKQQQSQIDQLKQRLDDLATTKIKN